MHQRALIMIWIIVLLLLTTVVSAYYSVKFAMVIIRVEDRLQESLDIMDEKHASITEILQRPLFFDSPEVRQVLRDIDGARRALHLIALELSKDFNVSDSE
jgi:uncharacterized membrane protein